MAKVGLTKLGLSVNKEIEHFKWNDQDIEIKQYLPIDDKLALCARVINNSADDLNYYNPGKLAVYQDIEIIMAYTNINFTEKQLESPTKLFDLLHSTGFALEIYNRIPEHEIGAITSIIEATVHNIYEYKNSVLGILDALKDDQNNLEFDATQIRDALADGENIELLKEIMTKLG